MLAQHSPALANAINVTSNRGTVQLILRRRERCADITVEGNGPDASEPDIDFHYQPFFRSNDASHTDGRGLGLAIVSRIIDAHGRKCEAENRSEGNLRKPLMLPLDSDGSQCSRHTQPMAQALDPPTAHTGRKKRLAGTAWPPIAVRPEHRRCVVQIHCLEDSQN